MQCRPLFAYDQIGLVQPCSCGATAISLAFAKSCAHATNVWDDEDFFEQ